MLPYILAAIGGWLIGDSLESKTPSAAVTEIKDDVVEAVIDIKDDVVDTVDTKKPDGYAKGGNVGASPRNKKSDGQREAKPMGWRWKDEAVTDGIITEKNLYSKPSAANIKKYPDFVYQEKRDTKADKKPSKKYVSLGNGGKTGGTAKKSGGSGKVGMISAHAKATRKDGEKWTDAIKRASAELKQQGKI